MPARLGCAIAEAYASAGSSVMVTDIDEGAAADVASAIEDEGGSAASARLDTTDPDQHVDVVKGFQERFGGSTLRRTTPA